MVFELTSRGLTVNMCAKNAAGVQLEFACQVCRSYDIEVMSKLQVW